MGYDRYSRGTPQGDPYGRQNTQDIGRDYGSGRDYTYSSARDYEAAGRLDDGDRDGRGQGGRDYGNRRYEQREQFNRGRDYGRHDQWQAGGGDEYRGAYASDGRRWENSGRDQWRSDDREQRGGRGPDRQPARGGYGRQPQGYEYEDRGFMARAGDEVRSWFGDEEAERRREMDSRMDDRHGSDRDSDYHQWRHQQMSALDRDYHEYRQENRSKFENEFATWRSARQGQRDALGKVTEHMEVVGTDGSHVGTVDKVRGDRIILTKNDVDAGGHHHSIPSRWIAQVDDKVTLSKSADEAKKAWRDEENAQAMFGQERHDQPRGDQQRDGDGARWGQGGHNLNRSFSGTY